MWGRWTAGEVAYLPAFIVSTGAGVPALWGFRTCKTFGSDPLVVRSLLLSALSLCLWWVVFEICLYSRFKGVFSAVYGVCVGLCCLRALRGLCGFCARVELGGLKACGVFPSIYPFICLSFYLFTCFLSFALSALLWLSFFVLLHCLCGSLGVVVVSFSLSDYTQKERAQRFCPLRPLLSCCGLVMQNRVLRSRKTRNYWPQCLLLCIRRSWSIHNRSATARKNLWEYYWQIPAR